MEKPHHPFLIKKILFVSHKKAQCGVYEFGKNITDVLQYTQRYQFIRIECSSLAELQTAIAEYAPAAIIYNYFSSVLPWVATKTGPKLYRNNIASIPIPQIGIIHETTQRVADAATNYKKRLLFGGTFPLMAGITAGTGVCVNGLIERRLTGSSFDGKKDKASQNGSLCND